MQNQPGVLTVPRSKSFWDEGCMALLLVLSAAQIAYCFAAGAAPAPTPKVSMVAPASTPQKA